jgi:hypothetical protein
MSAHNFDGSHPSAGVSDNTALPLHDGPTQPLIQASGPGSGLVNPGSDSGDDRAPAAVPMHPYGWEDAANALFDLNPTRKG